MPASLRSRLVVTAAAAALLAVVSGRAWAQAPESPRLEPITLQLKWRHQFQSAGFYAAVEKGFYRAAGLDVRLREPEVNEEPADVVLRGLADFGIATSDLVLLRNQGRPVVVLAPIFQHSPFVFLVAQGSGVSSIHDLKGKTLMIEPHAAELLAYLEFEGIPRDQVTSVPHAFDPSALIDGKVAAISAYSTDEPFLLQSAGVPYLTLTPRAAGIDFYGDTLFTTEAQLDEHPERTRRFLEASLEGWRYALANPDEIVELILAKYSQRHTREHLLFEAEASRRLILPDVVEVGYINPGRWQHIADVYSRLGMMPPGASLDGFLYQQRRDPNLGRLYAALTVAAVIIGVLSAVTVRFSRLNARIRQQAASLEKALGEIKVLKGIIPICAHCKNVRDDQGYWKQVENYIAERTDAEFSHAVCSRCTRVLYPELYSEPDAV